MNDEEKEKDVVNVISRIKHLSEKTNNLLNSDSKILFWFNHKFDASNSEEAIKTCDDLYEAVLNKTKNKNSNIIFFVNDNEYKLLKRYKNKRKYKIQNVVKFAPSENALSINYKAYEKAMKNYDIKNVKMNKDNIQEYKIKHLGALPLKRKLAIKFPFLANIYKKIRIKHIK